MRGLFSEYGDTTLSIVVGVVTLSLFIGILFSEIIPVSVEAIETNVNDKIVENDKIVSIKEFIVKDGTCHQGEGYDYQNKIIAINSRDENIKNFVSLNEPIDTSEVGEQEVTYVLRYNGEKRVGKAKVFIEAIMEEENEKYG